MKKSQVDSILEQINLISEESELFSIEQVKKLEEIRTKVGELLKKTQQESQPAKNPAIKHSSVKQRAAISEKIVSSFEEYVQIDEMIKKRGKNWVVLNSTGKKVLGTHPSKKKAVKQLQAIEISKHK